MEYKAFRHVNRFECRKSIYFYGIHKDYHVHPVTAIEVKKKRLVINAKTKALFYSSLAINHIYFII